MLVVVGSDNPVKIKAVENVFKAWYGECETTGGRVETELPGQPLDLSQTLEGAIRRAQKAIELSPNADFSVGVEAGLIKIPNEDWRYFDQQIAAVLDSKGWMTLGGGPSFEHPKSVLERVLAENKEVGDVFETVSGIPNIGRQEGAVGYLSKGRVSRLSITEVAVSMALIPRIMPTLYR
ncbi:MAG: inosine/xanthosine triphosphatase [Candidatus Bathyarchaeota archaeon]|nr:MAG: inosine/xanthosine triphosphatase [Candidatus Bathyarchaeota archaeon]